VSYPDPRSVHCEIASSSTKRVPARYYLFPFISSKSAPTITHLTSCHSSARHHRSRPKPLHRCSVISRALLRSKITCSANHNNRLICSGKHSNNLRLQAICSGKYSNNLRLQAICSDKYSNNLRLQAILSGQETRLSHSQLRTSSKT